VGDYKGAAEDLNDFRLNGEREAVLWRGLISARQRHWSVAANTLASVFDVIQFHPPYLKVKFALLAADTAVATGDPGPVGYFLDLVAKNDPDQGARAWSKYLRGRLKQMEGDREGALALWDEVIAGADRLGRAHATLARVNLLLEDQTMPKAEAVEELERLSFVWRGDIFELDLLRRLGGLYFSIGDYQAGLSTLRSALARFPDYEDSRLLAIEMSEAFNKLYLEGAADSLPPVKALAIYNEFRELTPTGEKGDEMALKLAERLLAVDLLGQAADLIENQVKFRLTGADQAEAGARLAMVRLLDKKPEMAIEALRASAGPDLSDDLTDERRLLEARALVDLNRKFDALALLEGDESRGGVRLRADVLWRNRNWPEAADALRRILADNWQGVTELGDEESEIVLRLAVALLLDGNEARLARLRRKYGTAMEGSRYADDFRVISAAPSDDPKTIQAIAARVAEVDRFDAFMAGYRARLEGPKVAAAK
jgi:tetratricopeptide (TPR) repeat protein